MSSLSRDNPSFSSTLLDEIYRSIDEQSTVTARKKQSKFGASKPRNCGFEDDHDDERRARLIQKWMENKVREKPVVGRRSAADHDRSSMRYEREAFCLNSSSSSCDSCYGGGVSLSETESVYGFPVKPNSKPRPIRTGVYQYQYRYQHDEIINREKLQRPEDSETKSKHEGKFVKTKSKALKIYSDLKKVKQPISPGGRLASFLNSIFTTGNNKKPNISSTTAASASAAAAAAADGGYTDVARRHLDRKSKSANASTCSSASSFSRSCLSNSSSSRGAKSSNGIKRTVRFYPVDEDYQPYGHKSLHKEESSFNSTKSTQNSINKEVSFNNSSDKNRHISEAARNLLKKYQKKVKCEFDSNKYYNGNEEQSDDNDGRSDSSSDLFELDNLSTIGMDKYQEELPVYETTRLNVNRAIADGLYM